MVYQDQSAMKVCTDSCIQGAYTQVGPAQKVLDIGTGTGLLSLMLAQKKEAIKITALEIDPKAAQQAAANFKNSPWASHLELRAESLQSFIKNDPGPVFDLIISNPPFFSNHLISPRARKTQALHSGKLNQEDLLAGILKLLSPQGKASIMYPPYEAETFEKKARMHGLFVHRSLEICHREGVKPIRLIQEFSLALPPLLKKEKLVIKDQQGHYTQDFSKLLRDYYLIF